MKKLFILLALVLSSTAAHANYYDDVCGEGRYQSRDLSYTSRELYAACNDYVADKRSGRETKHDKARIEAAAQNPHRDQRYHYWDDREHWDNGQHGAYGNYQSPAYYHKH